MKYAVGCLQLTSIILLCDAVCKIRSVAKVLKEKMPMLSMDTKIMAYHLGLCVLYICSVGLYYSFVYITVMGTHPT